MKNLSFIRIIIQAISILAIGSAFAAFAAAEGAIGMAIANGGFRVDDGEVWGSATLFDGTRLDTMNAGLEVRLRGTSLRLASDSRIRTYERKAVLESGYIEVMSSVRYEIEARSLHISGATPDSLARIGLEGERKVRVAVLRGGVRVANELGLVVAQVEAGKSLDLEPQVAGAAAPTRAAGCLLAKSGKFLIIEQTANVVLELQGEGLENEIGNHVEVVGAPESAHPSIPGATQLISVVGLKELSKGGCTAVAKKLGASATIVTAATGASAAAAAGSASAAGAAGAAAAGVGAGTVAVIGGVAAAATVGGLAAAGSLPGQSDSSRSASR